jgi:hypothetical protein
MISGLSSALPDMVTRQANDIKALMLDPFDFAGQAFAEDKLRCVPGALSQSQPVRE